MEFLKSKYTIGLPDISYIGSLLKFTQKGAESTEITHFDGFDEPSVASKGCGTSNS
jgi:hypothetical protein